jgi:hypothetical protein
MRRLKSFTADILISSFPLEFIAQKFEHLCALHYSCQSICSGTVAKRDDVFNSDQGRFRIKRRWLRLFRLGLSALILVWFTWYFRCSVRFIAIRTGGPGNPGLAGRIKA